MSSQAVEQIGSEKALGLKGSQIAVGCGDKPHVGLHGNVRSHGKVFAFLEHAQEFELGGGAEIADLVKEQGASGRLVHQAVTHLFGLGKRSF